MAEVFTPGAPLRHDRRSGWPTPSTEREESRAAGTSEARRRRPAGPQTDPRRPHARARSRDDDDPARAQQRNDRSIGGSLRVPGQAVLRPLRHPDVARRRRRHRRRGRGPGRRGRLPGGGQGPGEGGRPGQGRRHQAGRRRRRGPHATPRPSWAWTSRATSCTGCGSSTPRTSPRSTTPASPSTGPPSCTSCMVSAKGGVDIEEVAADEPEAIARLHVDPGRRASTEAAARHGRGGRPRPRGPGAGGRAPASSSTAATSRATATWPRSTR